MGRQKEVKLHRDRYQKDISEGRWGDRELRSYIGMPRKREREEERKKRKSRDLSDRSLKTGGQTESREPTLG